MGKGPIDVVVNPNTNTIYVVNYLNNTISVIDGQTNHVTKNIPVEESPRGVVVNPIQI